MESELVLPYGPAPAVSFIIHEIVMVALFAVCLFHAVRRGATFISYLLGGVLFGLLLEYVNVNAGLNYSYGQFWLMLGPTPEPGAIPQNIPVNIGIGWGIIIYTVRLFSDNLGLPLWSRPVWDALLALNVDLSMDVVAYRLNMWHWGWEFLPSQPDPLTSDWFGIPYANFFGWLSVVFFYSAFARILLRWQSKKGLRWLRLSISVVAAIILAQICLFLSIRLLPGWISDLQEALFSLIIDPYIVLTITTLIAFLSIAVIGFKRRQTPERIDDHPITWLVPTYFHVYFIAWLFIAGFYRETFWLPAVSLLNAAVGIVIHQWGSLTRKKLEMLTMSDVAVET